MAKGERRGNRAAKKLKKEKNQSHRHAAKPESRDLATELSLAKRLFRTARCPDLANSRSMASLMRRAVAIEWKVRSRARGRPISVAFGCSDTNSHLALL
jgi:hypothetical protein